MFLLSVSSNHYSLANEHIITNTKKTLNEKF